MISHTPNQMETRGKGKRCERGRILGFRAFFTESALWTLVFLKVSHPQVLITGENGGSGGQTVMLSANAIQPKDFGTLTNVWLQYGYGVTDHIDGFLSYGNITVFGRSQSYAAIGANIGVLRRSRAGLDVAFYNNASLPINHREQASPVLLSSALIASRPVKLGGWGITPYGGVSPLTPIGGTREPFFTPPSSVYNGIVGVSVTVGRVAFYLEYNPGDIQRNSGGGILYVFPQHASPGTRLNEPSKTRMPK